MRHKVIITVISSNVLTMNTFDVEVARARDSLNGRFFGGRTVRAEVYDQTLYEDNDLSG